MIVNKIEKNIDKCENRFRCLTEKRKECGCIHRPIEYFCNQRTTIKDIAEYYKRDVCGLCFSKTLCGRTNFRMKFQGSSKKNGKWDHSYTINKKNMYPLFNYLVFCPYFNDLNRNFIPQKV